MPATEVGKIRNPVRPLSTTNVAMAFPGELLVDPNSGGFIYVTPEGTHLTHRKPGTLTLRYGETLLCNAQDLADAIDLTIPAAAAPGKLTLKYGTQTLVNAQSMGGDISVTIPEPEVDVSTLVPVSRTINGHALSENIALTAADVGARPNTWTPTAADVGAVPTARKVNGKALTEDISLTAADVSARPSTWTPTAADVGAVPTARKVNGKALTEDISLTAADVSARPSTWTPTASDVGALPISGGTLTGKTTFSNGIAITKADSNSSLSFFLGIKAFAEGGDVQWIANADVAACIGAVKVGYAHNIGGVINNLQLSTSWTGSAAPYTQEIQIAANLAADQPTVDFRPTGTYATDKTAEEAWLNVYRVESLAGKLKFYAHAKPTVAIPIIVKYT